MNKSKIINYLKECSGAELAQILVQVLESREENVKDPIAELRLVFAIAQRNKEKNEQWSEWRTRVVGVHNSGYEFKGTSYEGGEPYCQYGSCPGCKIGLCSYVKEAICPLCKENASLS